MSLRNKRINQSRANRISWKEDSRGFLLNIGSKYGRRPIYLHFTFAMIKNKKIAFYYPTSEFVDYKNIEEFLIENFQLTHDNYTRWNQTDATNFHICVLGLDSLDKEPRETIYQK